MKRLSLVSLVLAWLALVAALLCCFGQLADAPLRHRFYMADYLYLPALFHDLSHHTDLSGWRLTPAPYYFPDMLLYFALESVTHSFHLSIVLYGILQVLGIAIGWQLVLKKAAPDNPLPRVASLLLLTFLVVALARAHIFYLDIFLSGNHISLALALPWLSLALLSDSKKYGPLLALLCFLLTLSDRLFLLQVLLPLLAVSVAFPRTVPTRRWALPLQLGISAGLGMGAGRLLDRYHTLAEQQAYSLAHRSEGRQELAQWIGELGKITPTGGALLVASLLALIIALGVGARKKQLASFGPKLALALLLQVLGALLAVPLLGLGAHRYFSGMVLTLSIASIPLLLSLFSPHRLGAPLLALVALALAAPGLPALGHLGDWTSYYPPLIRQLDETVGTTPGAVGVGSYWWAKYVQLLSRRGVQVLPITSEGKPFHWINNRAVFKAEPHFALLDAPYYSEPPPPREETVPAAWLERSFGKPDRQAQVGNCRLWFYDSTAFARQLLDHPEVFWENRVGESIRFMGSALPGRVGTVEGTARHAAAGVKGCLSFGPYLPVTPGTYRAQLDLVQPPTARDGTWEVALSPGDTLLARGSLRDQSTIPITIPQPGILEVRVISGGGAALTLRGLELTRTR